ncbi:hypothetical protein QJS10_CPA05g01619 [Acorus calamus]|uniref:BSD domain-containing protein n=1 Tax=Acorus calamus TaxID=4465 RepID=A0AAV9ERJ4_ACOCL|nr:hypothetical protein QJS10_CPA05g01619 [Acorus calamus]
MSRPTKVRVGPASVQAVFDGLDLLHVRNISLVNSLRSDGDGDDDDERIGGGDGTGTSEAAAAGTESPRGVKEDLSELTKTLSRQFWGVANFLAPSPETSSTADHHPDEEEEAPAVPGEEERSPRVSEGTRSDFAEIGGGFRTGISMLSSNLAVAEISKIASNFLPLGLDGSDVDDDYEEGAYVETEGAVGVTEEVLAFARNISRHPETWLDFPLLIVEARAMLLKELQNRTKPEFDVSGRDGTSYAKEATFSVPQVQHATRHNNFNETPQFEPPTYEETQNAAPSTDIETEKHTITATEMQVIDKSVVEDSLIQTKDKNLPTTVVKEEEDGDDWLEETAEVDGSGSSVILPLVNEEDVSFSDLEDDDDNDNRSAAVSSTIKNVTPTSVPQEEDSKGWGLCKVSGNSAKVVTSKAIPAQTPMIPMIGWT